MLPVASIYITEIVHCIKTKSLQQNVEFHSYDS